MKILAIETSGNNCSIAIIDEEKVISEFSLNTGTTHSQNLVPMLKQVQKFSNIELDEIDAIACSIGPGSFTGLRIGIATVKGIALSLNKPVIGIPSLTGLAYNTPPFDGIICSILDAKNDNVYAAVFENKESIKMTSQYFTNTIYDLIEYLNKQNQKILFVGDGAVAYKNKIKEALNEKAIFMPLHLNTQLATSIAKAALDKAQINEYESYDTLTPLYLKKSQAERMLESESNNNK